MRLQYSLWHLLSTMYFLLQRLYMEYTFCSATIATYISSFCPSVRSSVFIYASTNGPPTSLFPVNYIIITDLVIKNVMKFIDSVLHISICQLWYFYRCYLCFWWDKSVPSFSLVYTSILKRHPTMQKFVLQSIVGLIFLCVISSSHVFFFFLVNCKSSRHPDWHTPPS